MQRENDYTNKNEVHFIARRDSREYYIQIMDQIPSQEKYLSNEYNALLAVPGSFKKIVVINSLFSSYTDEEGILTISLEDFLLQTNSLDL